MTPSGSTLDRFCKLSLSIVAVMLILGMVFYIGQALGHIVVLVGLAFFITYLLLAPVNTMAWLLDRLTYGILSPVWIRVTSIFMIYGLFCFTLLILSVRFVPVAIEQLYEFSTELPHYVHEGEEWLLNLTVAQNYFHQEVEVLASQGKATLPQEDWQKIQSRHQAPQPVKLTPAEKEVIREKVFLTPEQVNHMVRSHLAQAFRDFFHLISSTLMGFIYGLTGLVLIFYFLLDGFTLKMGFLQMLPAEAQPNADRFLCALHNVMFGYTKAHIILGALTGVYVILINTMFGIPYAVFLGTFFAVAQILPVVGPWVGLIPWLLVLHLVAPVKILLALGCIGVFQLIKDIWLGPKVMGHVMELHPVIVIISLLVCAKAMGVVGFVFAIPLASMVNVTIRFLQNKGEHPHEKLESPM